jgi:hypothetical protein
MGVASLVGFRDGGAAGLDINVVAMPACPHSVLTEHLTDEPGQPTHAALHRMLDFLRSRLQVS